MQKDTIFRNSSNLTENTIIPFHHELPEMKQYNVNINYNNDLYFFTFFSYTTLEIHLTFK